MTGVQTCALPISQQSGLEPDECYIVGDQGKPAPDLAIEIAWTSGGLGIVEVWFWRAGRIEVYVLRQQRHERTDRSALFPDLDVALLCSFLDRPTALQAVKAFGEALRG